MAVIALLRVYLGWQWLSSGIEKVFGSASDLWIGSKAGTTVTGFLQGALQKTAGTHPDVQWWYAEFLRTVAIPHAKLFSYAVAWGELILGVCLIVGLFTTLALFGGIFLNMNYLFAGTVSTNPQLLLLAAILLWAGPAAHYWVLTDLGDHGKSPKNECTSSHISTLACLKHVLREYHLITVLINPLSLENLKIF